MAAAARLHAIEKNRDPRRYSLLAFGGAGPAHAVAVARLLDIEEVIFPPGAGVAAALGCLVAAPSIDLARTYAGRLDRLDWNRVASIFSTMETEAICGAGRLRRRPRRDCVGRDTSISASKASITN